MYKPLDTVALIHDLPHAGLRSGDIGAIVEVFAADAMDVEFVTAAGRTRALLTLKPQDIRPVGDHDQLAVRSTAGARR